jgi:cyclase
VAAVPTNVLHELADGVLVWVQPGGESGVSNAAAVVDDDGVTVVDTLMVPSQWEPFAAAVNGLGLPVRRIVLTHAHIDHVGGAKAFPHAGVYGSPQTSQLLDGEMPVGAYKAFMPAFADEFDTLAELGTRPVTHLVTDAATLTGRIEVLPATGHTAGDVMVLVPDADVVLAGDLCFFGVTPLAFQGDPATWAAVVETVGELAEHVVPGHGQVGGAAECRVLADYLRACVDAHGDPSAIPAGPWDDWPERAPRDEINVERAQLLAEGRDEMPRSMLRAIGLA